MIRVNAIHIEEFRGIRDLTLTLDAKNFGICGPNGTGKSGVVDAIEFCITGDITRLKTIGDLKLKVHAPHVDQNKNPEKANVTIVADIPSLKKSVKIHRSVKDPRKVEITPDDEDVKAVIQELQIHPEFALSRREIVKYIITPPGKRSVDVQTLLRLEHIENLRKNLTTFNNKRKRETDEGARVLLQAEKELKKALKIDNLKSALVLEKVNEKRKLLKLEDIKELSDDTSFKSGVASPTGGQKKQALRKVEALADITDLQSAIKDGEPSALTESRQAVKIYLEKLKEDESALTLVKKYGFIKTGLDFISGDACPLCDTEWKAEELHKYLSEKLLNANKLKQFLEQLRNNINIILASISERIQAVKRTIAYCQGLKPPIKDFELSEYLTELKDAETAFSDFLEDYSKIDPVLQAISVVWWLPKTEQQVLIDECFKAVDDLPDTSAEDVARDTLIVAQERYEKLLGAQKTSEEQRVRYNIALKVLEHYNASCTEVLDGIYDTVAKDFTNYYCVINHEDEEQFIGKLESAPAKLSFDVDFYGRGLFPPGAYHSEGHQDSMGLCLYLALMKHTLGGKFTFAVLDDVLMSVDTGHRREVCRLLKTEFPDTQFILTTHDRVWLQYMRTENLIARSQVFAGWTVDTGPRVWDDLDIWTEIKKELDKNDVARAASLLRRYLEYTANILADNLRARIEFKGDGHYNLGDLLPPTLKRWKERLKEGEESAVHWGRDEEKDAIIVKQATTKKLIAKTNAEQWAINPSVHYNEWADLQPHEFQEVVVAFKELIESLRCENVSCKSYLYVMPRTGKAEEMRCNCGETNINLKVGK